MVPVFFIPFFGFCCLAVLEWSTRVHPDARKDVGIEKLKINDEIHRSILMDLFKKKSSGDVAKDRLKLLLVSDRANCSPEMMEMIKRDIIQVISKYMDIDADALDVKITETESDSNNGMVPALFANIPIKDMKHKPDKR